MFGGFEIKVTEDAMVTRWVYPVERFWEYVPSPETESWCRYFGFGHEVREPGAVRVGDVLCVHPIVMKACKERMEQARKKIFELPMFSTGNIVTI